MSPDGRWCRSSGCDATDFHFGGGLGEGGEGRGCIGLGRDRTGGDGTGHCWMFSLFRFGIPVFGVRCLRMDMDMGVNVSMSMACILV